MDAEECRGMPINGCQWMPTNADGCRCMPINADGCRFISFHKKSVLSSIKGVPFGEVVPPVSSVTQNLKLHKKS